MEIIGFVAALLLPIIGGHLLQAHVWRGTADGSTKRPPLTPPMRLLVGTLLAAPVVFCIALVIFRVGLLAHIGAAALQRLFLFGCWIFISVLFSLTVPFHDEEPIAPADGDALADPNAGVDGA